MTNDLVTTIIQETGEVTGEDPSELPPLYESVDPDALEAIEKDVECVRFTYADCEIVIKDGDVAVESTQ